LQVLENGVFVEQALIGATNQVEERRAETTLTHSRALSPKWDLQVSAGVEYSKLEVVGQPADDFIRPKGYIRANYQPKDGTSIRLDLERRVGQLSFFDFISSVDVVDNIDQAANVNLVPQQDWRVGFEYTDYKGFRLFTTDDPTLERPISYGFVEHKDVFGMKVKAELINLFNSSEDFTREVFTDWRDRGVLDFTEFQQRKFGSILNIEFSGTF
jgi:hypothetical protein